MYTVYVILSAVTGKYYVGHTEDMEQRLREHNLGLSKYTRTGRPWRLVYREQYVTRSEAVRREKEIKARKSRKYLEDLSKTSG